jgi:transposase
VARGYGNERCVGGGGSEREVAELSEVIEALLARVASLEARLAEVERERDELRRERDEYRTLYLLAREENERLKRGLVGQVAQRVPQDDAQLSLAVLGLVLGNEPGPSSQAPRAAQVVPAHTRQKPVRKPLPEHLPRVVIEIVPPEVERQGQDAFEVIGIDTRQVLERRPASLVVVEVVKKKFVRKESAGAARTEVLEGETPELPIPRGMAGPGLLADTIVKRWQDHQPLHRLESVYRREGIELNRSTICTWHAELCELVEPLVKEMHADALRQPYLCTDATGVLVQHPLRCKHGHFWVLVAPGKHVLFEFTMKHDAQAVDGILGGYSGTIVADAHAVYDHLYEDKNGKATEAGCWSHMRKYVLQAMAVDPERLREPLSFVQALFMIERTVDRAPPLDRARVRSERSRPIAAKFFDWCREQQESALEHSPLHEAIRYATNHETALCRFLDDARLPIHNNISEMHLRRQAIGRKNWLFVGSEDGGKVNTRFVSLLASCAMHRIEPWGYLRDVLCLLPEWPITRVLELAPANWQATSAMPSVQDKLAANIFRRATLLEHQRAVA